MWETDSHTENDYFILSLQVIESWGMRHLSQEFIDFFENIIFHMTVIGQGSNVRWTTWHEGPSLIQCFSPKYPIYKLNLGCELFDIKSFSIKAVLLLS